MKWLPGIILVLAAVVLAVAWSELPDRWVIHWGITGRADGWATKDVLAVFGPLLVAAVVWIAVESLVAVVGKTASRPAGVASMSAALRLTEIALALAVAIASIGLPLGRPSSPLGLVVVTLLVVGVGVTASVVRMVRLGPTVAANTTEEGWHGVVYRNVRDPAPLGSQTVRFGVDDEFRSSNGVAGAAAFHLARDRCCRRCGHRRATEPLSRSRHGCPTHGAQFLRA